MLRPVGPLGLRLSVIVTTYNNPHALDLVLAGLARQSVGDYELIVADDGSGPVTSSLISQHAARVAVPVRHLWHPDEGFRKCAISNRAILAAAGDYLVFFDGDCVPSRHCLAVHLAAARRDSYLAGGAVPLTRELGDRLTAEEVGRGRLDRLTPWSPQVGKRRRLLVSRIPVLRDW
ncbi:MAG: glycosyltransferase, partial [Gemmatimonadales bacterium]|nr:glycosyltransferase [Gemmatimonadales bacterium]